MSASNVGGVEASVSASSGGGVDASVLASSGGAVKASVSASTGEEESRPVCRRVSGNRGHTKDVKTATCTASATCDVIDHEEGIPVLPS